jgi:hypothetical protein
MNTKKIKIETSVPKEPRIPSQTLTNPDMLKEWELYRVYWLNRVGAYENMQTQIEELKGTIDQGKKILSELIVKHYGYRVCEMCKSEYKIIFLIVCSECQQREVVGLCERKTCHDSLFIREKDTFMTPPRTCCCADKHSHERTISRFCL